MLRRPLAWVLLAVGLAIGIACGTSSSTGLPPVTGIIIRAETLTTGRGCGVGPTQLYKYVATVYADEELTQEVVTNLFDCFTDGTFVSIPGGDRTFHLKVFAFNKPTFDAFGANVTNANWTTTCSATQLTDVLVLADCLPLGSGNLGEGAVSVTTSSFPLPDGGVATCGALGDAGPGTDADTSPADAGDDADPDAAAPDAGPARPSTATYAKAILRFVKRGTAEIVSQTTVACAAAPFTTTLPSADYRIDVGLVDTTDAPVAQLTCSVSARPGATTTASCP